MKRTNQNPTSLASALKTEGELILWRMKRISTLESTLDSLGYESKLIDASEHKAWEQEDKKKLKTALALVTKRRLQVAKEEATAKVYLEQLRECNAMDSRKIIDALGIH